MIMPSRGFVEELKHACIQAGLNARDFCGNERQAIISAAKEKGVNLFDATIFQIIQEVDKEWVKATKNGGHDGKRVDQESQGVGGREHKAPYV